MKWIDIKDSIPLEGQRVLIWTKHGTVYGYLDVIDYKLKQYTWLNLICRCNEYDVTHWMPLPEAPK